MSYKPNSLLNNKSDIRDIECGQCKLKYNSSRQHFCVFQCDICKRAYKRFKNLKVHIEKHCKENEAQTESEKYICNKCKKSFKRFSNLKIHILDCHLDIKHSCKSCKKCFASEKNLAKHCCTVNLTCSECQKTFTTKHLFKRHCLFHKNEIYKCHYCYTSFLKKKSLNSHITKYSCSKMARNYWFSQYDSSLCRICHLKFANNTELQQHFFNNHNGCPHKCIWCEKQFDTIIDFQKHIYYHNAEKYTCITCEKVYTSQEGYRKHKLKHANSQYKCKYCGTEFLMRRRADIHIEKCKKKAETTDIQKLKSTRQLNWESRIIVKKVRGVEAENTALNHSESTVQNDDDFLADRQGWFDAYFKEDNEAINFSDDEPPMNNYEMVQEPDSSSTENSSDCSGDEISVKIDFNYKICRLCKVQFELEYELLHHFIRNHPGEFPHKCPKCEEISPLFAQLKEHMKVHGIGTEAFHCGYCSKVFKSDNRRQRHLKKCLGDVTGGPSTKECRKCHKIFHTKCGYTRHKKSVCKREKKQQKTVDNQIYSDNENDNNDLEFEAIEPETTTLEESTKEEIIGNTITKELIVYKALDNEKKSSKDSKNNFPCRLCEETFPFERGLVFHFKKIHPGVKPLICPHCGIALADKLKEHLKTHGIGEEFVCELCHKTFNQKFLSKIHELWHQGIEHKCQSCNQKFLTEEKMQKHVNSNKCTNRRSLMMLPCNLCGRFYRSHFGLQNHYLTHTPREQRPVKKRFNCEFCGKWFETANGLLRHTRTHTGEKPYFCRFCPRSFAQEGNCKVHEKIHTGESKPRKKKLADPPPTTVFVFNNINQDIQ